MLSQRLEKFKTQLPLLAQTTDRLEAYIIHRFEEHLERQADGESATINLRFVSNKFDISEEYCLTILREFVDEGVLTTYLDVLCPDTYQFLGQYDSLESIPITIFCTFHAREAWHNRDECLVEWVFKFTSNAAKKLPVLA